MSDDSNILEACPSLEPSSPRRVRSLDVVIPTYNRSRLLVRTLQSLANAEQPSGLDLHIVVSDNNSTDDTKEVTESFARKFPGRCHYVRARKQGRSSALNAGIRASTGELVGMIDDDEEVDPLWLTVIDQAFGDSNLDFIGGPCRGKYEVPQPSWLPPGYPAITGVIDGGSEPMDYGPAYPGILMGGNAVIRRELLERIGLYNENLGRTNKGLLSGEDAEMFRRLMANGARGRYLPALAIDHHIPASRLTKSYYRHWCYGHGISMGVLDRNDPQPVKYVLGIPRYMIGSALKSLCSKLTRPILGNRDPGKAFAQELEMWGLLGFVVGKLGSLAR